MLSALHQVRHTKRARIPCQELLLGMFRSLAVKPGSPLRALLAQASFKHGVPAHQLSASKSVLLDSMLQIGDELFHTSSTGVPAMREEPIAHARAEWQRA